jgi:hypothetical protein
VFKRSLKQELEQTYEQALEKVLEGQVEGLGGEVTDDVGGVTSPEGDHALLGVSAAGAVGDAAVRGGQTTALDHLALVLDLNLFH